MNVRSAPPGPARGLSRRTRLLAIPAVIGTLAVLAGCSSAAPASESESSAPAVAVNEEARAMLPADIIDSGELKLVAPFTYPPFIYLDEQQQMSGSDYEIGLEIGSRLGLESNWTRIQSFDALVPSIENGRFDATFNAMSATPERAAVVSLVDYMQSTWTVLVKKGNPAGIDPNDLCGMKSGGTVSSTEVLAMNAISAQCVADGKDPIELVTYQTGDQPVAAIASGQIEGYVEFTVRAEDLVKKQPDDFEVLEADEPVYPPGQLAVIVRPSAPGLARAIDAVLQDMYDDGTTARILAENDVPADSLIAPEIYPGSLQE
ncbi:transporter substrate-binding domain-containing protein [Cnuibacter physcomitrellae]|uniref:transporter substrate-binding domain-containing protein n=1 Tax=Cnuibacter physcomitrellae TaxID=1619308 RepID=UPI002175B4CC|nr:transporter substrate-binding domain-containing protein [Cnuibacter physcomitrellae]MCS5498276.1 transporter substrate-binding domain-containing protein [Cnuibacter physcomitrellae]